MEDRTIPPKNERETTLQADEVPLLFNIPVGLASRYAHHLLVQTTEHDVVLSFFEVMPPVLQGSIEEQQAALAKGVRADCVSRVAIARGRYLDFVKAIYSQLRPEEKKEVSK